MISHKQNIYTTSCKAQKTLLKMKIERILVTKDREEGCENSMSWARQSSLTIPTANVDTCNESTED